MTASSTGTRLRKRHQLRETRLRLLQAAPLEAQARGAALSVPADDLAPAVLAPGDRLMIQHVLMPGESTAQAYRLTLQAMWRTVTRSADKGQLS